MGPLHVPTGLGLKSAGLVLLRVAVALGGPVSLVGLLSATFFMGACADLSDEIPPDAVLWVRFAQISDMHICDEESPARAVLAENIIRAAWRPQEAFAIQTLDAMLRVLNQLNRGELGPERKLDFVIETGDAVDSAQYNELRWFIDTMDGKVVDPDSGAKEGAGLPVPPEINPNLLYVATGLDRSIPWYTVYGNHEGLAVGAFPIDRSDPDKEKWNAPLSSLIAAVIGLSTVGLDTLLPTGDLSPAIILANEENIDPKTMTLQRSKLKKGQIPPDKNRRYISRQEFIDEHFNSPTSPGPVGHGFSEANRSTGSTFYSFRPKSGIPLRVIVLDTVKNEAPLGSVTNAGEMTTDQFEKFLKPEVEGAARRGEYVIVASHHPTDEFWGGPGTVSQSTFRAFLLSQWNVLAHIVGHTHYDTITRVSGEHPYYEIVTGSLMDYPQEGRIFEVYYSKAKDKAVLRSGKIGHIENPTSFSLESLRRAKIIANADK